jgi:hypothetical protein
MLIIVSTVGKAIRQSFKEQRTISNPFPLTSPLHEPYKNYTEKLFAIPGIEQHFKNASSEDQAFAIAVRLSQKGMRRLDDISLISRISKPATVFICTGGTLSCFSK